MQDNTLPDNVHAREDRISIGGKSRGGKGSHTEGSCHEVKKKEPVPTAQRKGYQLIQKNQDRVKSEIFLSC